MSHVVTGLDIGTGSVRAVVLENRQGKPVLIRALRESSSGVRRGAISDTTEIMHALSRIFAKLRDTSRYATKNLYVNIGTAQARAQHSRGIVAVSRAESEIYPDDVERVVRASQAITLGSNRIIVDTITKEFMVDGVGDIADPIGLGGGRLEVATIIIDAFEPHIKNLFKVIHLNGGVVKKTIFDPLISARAALSKAQKNLGTVVIDLGLGTTSMAVYEEGRLLGTAVFPVGSGNVTNDIAVGLKLPVDVAEKLKLQYGYAIAREVGAREAIELKQFISDAKGTISRRLLAEIIEARLSETFEFLNSELRILGKSGQLPGGAVLVGGGAKLPGIADLATNELRLTTQIGLLADRHDWQETSPELERICEDPEYINVIGLGLWGVDEEGWGRRRTFNFNPKEWLRNLLP
ncbi:MAG: cell division protein FtsA [Anaplasmataceae bacterium]|nr:cell division protein FtsA [Anaplasmataceae bacterium]